MIWFVCAENFFTCLPRKQATGKFIHNGQVEITKVLKPKYENGSMEMRRKAAYQFLVSYWLTNVCVEAL